MKFFWFPNPDRKIHNMKSTAFRPFSRTAESTREGKNISSSQISHTSEISKDMRIFTYQELGAATKKFARGNLLGEGGFGSVFRGSIKQSGGKKLDVAVKQLNQESLQGDKEWLAEINFLGYLDHPNLVQLLGYCKEENDTGTHQLLVYELMPNRSLDWHLFFRPSYVLPWKVRVQIALGAARGLAYLHEEICSQVIFRDFKTPNILLDNNFNPKLSDFGFARQGPDIGYSHVTTRILGTDGYAAPEYLQTGHLNSKSDVWSFGVVLFELLTGRQAVDSNQPKHAQKLLQWVRPYVTNPLKYHKMLDPRLKGNYPLKAVHKIVTLACQCLQADPHVRPKMSLVVESLSSALELSLPPHFEESTTESVASKQPQEALLAAKAKRRWILKIFSLENGCLGCPEPSLDEIAC